MAELEHPRDRYEAWAKGPPLDRDGEGKFVKGNRGGPGRPPELPITTPDFLLPSGRIHPLFLNPEADMATHDSQLRHDSPHNITQLARANDLWQTILAEILCDDFTGQATVKLQIQRGIIQKVKAHTRNQPQ